MKYARVILNSINNIDSIFENLNLKYKSYYSFDDLIFNKGNDLLKVRMYKHNEWDSKNIILIYKKVEYDGDIKNDILLDKSEFDDEEELDKYLNEKYSDFEYSFSISKSGKEYENDKIRLWYEDVKCLGHTIEIGSNSDDEIKRVLNRFDIKEYMKEDLPTYLFNEKNNVNYLDYLGKKVYIKMDRPLGKMHPEYFYLYPVNYGFVPYTISGDGEEIDAYVLGEDVTLKEYNGEVIAIIHRLDDNDDKLVVTDGKNLTNEEIEQQVNFQEQYFKHIIIRSDNK